MKNFSDKSFEMRKNTRFFVIRKKILKKDFFFCCFFGIMVLSNLRGKTRVFISYDRIL